MKFSRVFQEGFKAVSRIFLRCFKEGSCEGVSRLLRYRKFNVACHSSQLHEQKEGLFFTGPQRATNWFQVNWMFGSEIIKTGLLIKGRHLALPKISQCSLKF